MLADDKLALHASTDPQGLEVYSTVLWHMKREVELSYLAQEAVTLDRQSPYAWCVMGNCFSLQKVRIRTAWPVGCRRLIGWGSFGGGKLRLLLTSCCITLTSA